MALLAKQRVVQTGLEPAFVAAESGGDTFTPGDDTWVHVKAGGTGATVTIVGERACNQGGLHDLVVVVPANEDRQIGPIPANQFADATTGLATVNYSQVATITVAVVAN